MITVTLKMGTMIVRLKNKGWCWSLILSTLVFILQHWKEVKELLGRECKIDSQGQTLEGDTGILAHHISLLPRGPEVTHPYIMYPVMVQCFQVQNSDWKIWKPDTAGISILEQQVDYHIRKEGMICEAIRHCS